MIEGEDEKEEEEKKKLLTVEGREMETQVAGTASKIGDERRK